MDIFSNGQNIPNNVLQGLQTRPFNPLPNYYQQPQWGGGGFQQLPFPSFLLQNLIQQIISQLLQALLNQNSNQATPFNDVLRGGDDAELIRGLGGNDQLFGNGGNDILRGGTGHDYLNGGQGNDSLFGGAGNDILQDDFGSNHLVGGEGHDTLRLSGRFSDYTFEKNLLIGTPENPAIPGSYNGFVVTNNSTGEFSTIESIENFQFADGSVTVEQLINHIDASQNIALTDEQNSAIRDRFDIGNGSTFRVIDRDASQSLSIGDELEIVVGGDAVTTITLTAEDIAAINSDPLPQELVLTDAQHDALANYFNQGTTVYNRSVIDQDGSGDLSVGDIAKLSIGGFAGNILVDHIITQQDLDAINNPPPQELNLSQEQQDAIGARFNRLPPPFSADFPTITYLGVATDQNGDGELSVGDTVKLRTTGGFAGVDIIEDHVLTADDIDAIQADRSNPLLDISNGLSNEQTQRLNNALFGGLAFTSAPSVQSVFDTNSDGKLSVGDYAIVSRFNETTGSEEISITQITQEHIDKFLYGNNVDALNALLENQQKWNDSGLEQSGYSFQLNRSAFAPAESIRPTISYVKPNGDVSDIFADNGQNVPENYNHANATIDSLFDEIKNAIESGADNVQVEYDPTSGYPTSIFIDFNQQIADEELNLSISNLNAFLEDWG